MNLKIGRREPPNARPRRLARWNRMLGSLQMAVILLLTFAAVLFLGTVVESRHGRPVAAQLVYRTWWFVLVLGGLGVNILFAALKKWPWKRHQTGFLITHAGLLTLIAGGFADSLFGTTGSLTLVTSTDQRFGDAGSNRGSQIVDRGTYRIRVRRPQSKNPDALDVAFAPGPLAWDVDGGSVGGRTDSLTRFLSILSDPRPDGWSRRLDDDALFEVLTYYPHAHLERIGPSDAQFRGPTFPAIQLQMSSPITGPLMPRWIAADRQRESIAMDPGRIDFISGSLRPEQIVEFQRPRSDAGALGEIVIGIGAAVFRLDLEKTRGSKPQQLGETGWNAAIDGPVDPRALDPQRSSRDDDSYRVTLRHPNLNGTGLEFLVSPRNPAGTRVDRAGESMTAMPIWLWRHTSPNRGGRPGPLAVLQFATADNGKLYYRSFGTRAGKNQSATQELGFEASGEVDPGGAWHSIWTGMNWRFRAVKVLSRARAGLFCTPVDRPSGAEDAGEPPAIRCRLTHRGQSEEFWLARGDDTWSTGNIGGETFEFGFHSTRHELGFDLTMLRGEQLTDPASGKPASLTSYVLLNDAERGIVDEPRLITLNEPLAHRGYRVYQGAISPLGPDGRGKPAFRVQLLANRDPGVWLKYVGSSMVALGIACMFYMRAYFFKRPERIESDVHASAEVAKAVKSDLHAPHF